MNKIILITLLLVFAGCSSDEKENNHVNKPKKEISKTSEKVVVKKENIKEIVKTTKSGKDIFQACAACHGEKADKPALGKSQIIKDWDADKIAAAINGYKNGTYGGAMKVLMIGQVGFLSDEEVQAVSEYISKL